MAQISKYPISDAIYKRISEMLMIVIGESFAKNNARHFLDAFFTPTEKVVFGKRLAIAVLLAKGYSYREIQHILHVSKPTIAHVRHNLDYGKKGYTQFVNKILRDERMKIFWEQAEDIVLGALSIAKGGGTWRYIHTEVKKRRKRKRTPV